MNGFEEMGKANIHAPDIVTEIKCPDGQYRNRPLLDVATVVEIIDELKKEMAE